ncbi:MAG: cell wall-active antibiotics response protein [Firmicutes bacterium]|jgi:hypothetical protein|nr:cell wall-active antibiotics response protein [Bacillota bacterium]
MERRGVGDLAGPLILIAIGVLLLLNTTGILRWDVWGSLWRYWPVLLIIWGVSIFFGRGSRVVGFLFVVFLVILGLFVASNVVPGAFDGMRWGEAPGAERTKQLAVSYDQYRPSEVDLEISIGAGQVFASTGATQNILDATATYVRDRDEPELDVSASGRRLSVKYGTDTRWTSFFPVPFRYRNEHRVTLGRPEIPTSLKFRVGAGNLDAAFDGLTATRLELAVGAGEAKVGFPTPGDIRAAGNPAVQFEAGAGTVHISQLGNVGARRIKGSVGSGTGYLDLTGAQTTGTVTADVEVGAGKMVILIPEGMGLRVDASIGAGSLWVDGTKYSTRDLGSSRRYLSPDYDRAASRLDLTVKIGAGRIEVEHTR